MDTISKDEFNILKTFINIPDHAMSQSLFDAYYPPGSDVRISAVRLINELHYIEYPAILNNKGQIESFDKSKLQITSNGRFAYKLYKDNAKHEHHKLIIDKAIPFCALIISFLSLLKSYGYGVEKIIYWCMQLLKR